MRKITLLIGLLLALTLLPSALAEDWEDWDEEEDREMPGYVDGDTLILPEGITALGYYGGEWVYDPETGEWDVIEHPEEEAWFEGAYCFDRYFYEDPDFFAVQWPSTFRYLGGEAFVGYHFRELTLPGTLEKIYNYSVSGDIDVLRIEAQLPWEQVGEIRWDGNGMDNIIGAYEAPEGHPLYKTVDGVLFTKDGKTLLSYPTGRTATHYDVPKGVERIADQAFINEYLQTISLPIGLKEVGDYGFSGCTRLQSIALPLTVTKIGKDIFSDCVSLELVSLPEGMEAERYENDFWIAYYSDDRIFRGDNGDTTAGIAPSSSAQYIRAPGRLTESAEEICAYPTSTETNQGWPLANGDMYWIVKFNDGRVLLDDPFTYENVGWVGVEYVEFLPSETLFSWAEAKPRTNMRAWFTRLPVPGEERDAWVVTPPEDDYEWQQYGPFLVLEGDLYRDRVDFACPIQDAILTRVPDGTDSVYAIVCNEEWFRDIPLLSGPGGEITEALIGGTQIRVLAEDEAGYAVTTGFASGWVAKEYVKIIPEKQEGN